MVSNICPVDGDNQFNIRVDIKCRAFDFTLLFEDAIFSILPSLAFLLWLIPRLEILRRSAVKSNSLKFAIYKSILLFVLFVLHIVFTVYQVQTVALHTKISTPAAAINIVATLAAIILSFLEDQRAIQPSDALIVYFSTLSILYIPHLRTLWLIPSIPVPRGLFTAIYIIVVTTTVLESARKVNFIKPLYQNVAIEEIHGFWGRNLFFWVLPLFRNAYKSIICLEDLTDIDSKLLGQCAEARLAQTWSNGHGKYRLIKATFRAYYRPLLSAIIPRILLAGFTFCQPFLLSATIEWMGSPMTAERQRYGNALVGAYALVYTGIAICTASYYRQASRLATVVRSGLIAMIHEQTLALRSTTGSKTGDAVALMGTDTTRITMSMRLLHEIWASLISVVIAIWLLESQVYVACVLPAVIAVVCIIATTPVSAKCGEAQKKWVGHIQERLAATTAMLGDMKAVKMMGLEVILFNIITRYRKVELSASRRFRKLIVGIVILSSISVDLAPYSVFLVYTIIAVTKHDAQILTTQAFTTLSLISILTTPLMALIQALPTVTQSIGCFDRIQNYCLRERSSELPPAQTKPEFSMGDSVELSKLSVAAKALGISASSDKFVSFQNASISWTAGSPAVLHDLTLSIPTGKIVMIVGSVGCGKSALLDTIMGQTQIESGTMYHAPGNIAYCPQTPWIMNSSIQDNITGWTALDQKWYDLTISACGLVDDINKFPQGSMHIAGSSGISLSGGQKQRVALARAVYSRLPNVLLDDTFSGLDAQNTRIVGERLFGRDGILRRTSTTVVLATHTRSLLPYADEVIVLKTGRRILQGTYQELIDQLPEYTQSRLDGNDDAVNAESNEITEPNPLSRHASSERSESESTELKKNLARRDGSWSIYSYYARKAGLLQVAFFALFLLAYGFTTQFSSIWLEWWSNANETDPNSHVGKYLGVYTVISLLAIFSLGAGCWMLIVEIVGNTSLALHSDLLQAVLRAPFSFFQKTDSGSIMNRFSQDMELIDFALPTTALNFVEGKHLITTHDQGSFINIIHPAFSLCVVSLVILCVVGKYITIALPFMLLAIWVLQHGYLRTSRQVRLLDIEAKALLFSHFQETVSGLSVIQSLQWQPEFHRQCIAKLDVTQKPFYMLYCIRQGLKLALDMLVMLLAVILVAVVTSLKDRFSAGEIGVALNLIISISQNLNTTIESWTEMEISLGAVARVQEFMKETPVEASEGIEAGWLTRAEIRFENVSAGYRLLTIFSWSDSPRDKPVLSDLSLKIPCGQKIAVCGPSGSGKTSLIMALLRMLELSQGRITIDNVDISTIHPAALRSQITVIPQDPFFLPGTLRDSFDPRGTLSEEQIVTAIKKVGLWESLSAKGGLDVTLDALDWSYGEKQLLALARALTTPSPLLILDEATSSVDWETEVRMLEIIEQECAAQTVIAVVHRLRHIERFDSVALLQNGSLIEFDAPGALLGRESEFRKLYTASQK
ncbi:ABC transporter integral membrane type 1 [Penicillium vulpinum]|uniref:ABC transporter integral membrane type 1 n=1 Tax=Penicillium vulpinum TaxID=29845 RepID=UPI002548668A|nr:ABC transporter integral membrane type 1 [Penicillium vulpinum]KAJ5971441.1 ABC transporter integral membrane type 1 [Penicillium vulpinum]